MALTLLRSKGVEPDIVDLNEEPQRKSEMIERAAGRQTVPQIFVDDQGIGGFDELAALDGAGRLDQLLRGTDQPS
jgi:glutaredoxin 3